MTRDEFRAGVAEERRGIDEKLAGNIFRGRRHGAEHLVVLIQEFMVEAVPQDPADPLLDFADVHQHPRRGIDDAGKNEIGDVISPGAITRGCLRAESRQVLGLAPFFDEQAPGCGKFEPFADRQEHDAAAL